MQLHADLQETVWYRGIDSGDRSWVSSPQPKVERLMLDRDGAEVAVATSLVRYAPDARFPEHGHALGEEYLVLEGGFGDEHGRYGPGTYVRNPPGTAHMPFAEPGCIIWVKLRQFHLADQQSLVLRPELAPLSNGQDEQLLHEFAMAEAVHGKATGVTLTERVAIRRAGAGERLVVPAQYCVQEVLVLAGAVQWQWEETVVFGRWGWLRLAAGAPLRLTVLESAVLLWKTRPVYRN